MTLNIILQSPPVDLVTRERLAEIAREEGLDLTVRTLRYWAQRKLIPRPWIVKGEGLRAFYPLSMMKRLRILSATRPQKIKSIRDSVSEAESIQFGDEMFEVLPALARWERDNAEFSIRMLEDGSGMLLIRRRKEVSDGDK